MKKIVPLIFLTTISLLLAEIPDSTKTKPVPFKRVVDKKDSQHLGSAPLISVFIPGGGHFYLGNKKTGMTYVLARALIIPGIALMVDNWQSPFGNKIVNEGGFNLGLGLCTIGLTSWIVDVVHAAVSANNRLQEIQDKKKLSYRIISDFEEKRYGVAFNYAFK